jgi:drug/metabolite transporter (DMT)-like permease
VASLSESVPATGARGNLIAVICVLMATAIFSLIFISGRFAGAAASPLQIMFLRYLGGFLTVCVLANAQGEGWKSLQSHHRLSQALRVVAGGLGGAAIIFGNAHMPLVDANAISLLSGVFTLALGFVIFRDRLPLWGIVGALLCLVGAAMVMAARGAFTTLDPAYLFPASVVAVGALLLAAEYIFIKLLAMSDRPMVTLAHANFFGMLILLIPAALTWGSTGWINLALLGLGPMAILGQYLNIRGYTATSVSLLAPIGYAALIFSALWGWLFFAEIPTAGVVAGCAVIAVGGITLALSRR